MKKRILALAMSLVMVFSITAPAFANESGGNSEPTPTTDPTPVLICNTPEHTHGEGCYETSDTLACGKEQTEGHTHVATCYQQTQICEKSTEAHVHDETCYSNVTTYACGLESGAGAHKHGDSCYAAPKLICNQEETEGHAHGNGCYEKELSCNLEESEDHQHGDSCYDLILTCDETECEGHTHSPACYAAPELICGMEETEGHIHTDACNGETKRELICTLSTEPHAHDDTCYEEKLICGEDTVEAHTHNEDCYKVLVCTSQEHTHTSACYAVPCTECGEVNGHSETCSKNAAPAPAPTGTCEYCGVELTEGAVHADDCLTRCTCDPKPAEGEKHTDKDCPFYAKECTCGAANGIHAEGCDFYVEPVTAAVYTRSEDVYTAVEQDEDSPLDVEEYNGQTIYVLPSDEPQNIYFLRETWPGLAGAYFSLNEDGSGVSALNSVKEGVFGDKSVAVTLAPDLEVGTTIILTAGQIVMDEAYIITIEVIEKLPDANQILAGNACIFCGAAEGEAHNPDCVCYRAPVTFGGNPPFEGVGPLLSDDTQYVVFSAENGTASVKSLAPSLRRLRTANVQMPLSDNTTPTASVDASSDDGAVTGQKSVTEIPATDDTPQMFEINLTAASTSETTSESCDFVLVLDMSYSMQGENLTALKNAVKSFVEKLYSMSKYSRVAIVTYGGDQNANQFYIYPVEQDRTTHTDVAIQMNEGNAQIKVADKGTDQQFIITPSNEDGYVHIISVATEKYLTIGNPGENSATLTQKDADGSDNQKWKMVYTKDAHDLDKDGVTDEYVTDTNGNPVYSFQCKLTSVGGTTDGSALYLDRSVGYVTDGTNVNTWMGGHIDAQMWSVEPVNSNPDYETYYWTNSKNSDGYGYDVNDSVADNAFLLISQNDGKEINQQLLNAINALEVYGEPWEGSHPGEAMEKATRILQAVKPANNANKEDYCEKTGEWYYNCKRGVLYFADGVPSPTDGVQLDNYPGSNAEAFLKYGIPYDFVNTYVDVQDALNWGKVLKYDKGGNIPESVQYYDDDNNAVDGQSQDPFDMYYINKAGIHERKEYTDLGGGDTVTGCGATLYVLTVRLATMDITSCSIDHEHDWVNLPNEDGTYVSVCLAKANDKTSGLYDSFDSRSNEYFYRLSSHRKDSTHVSFGSPYGRTDAQEAWHTAFTGGTGWSGRYPDFLCRNQEGSYFVSCDQVDDLEEVFNLIAVQTGKTLKDLVLTDNVTMSFVICDTDGNPLNNGDKVTSNGMEGTVLIEETTGLYRIVWTGIELNPGKADGTEAKKLDASFYVIPREGFLGGNGVPTNAGASLADQNGNPIMSYGNPQVNVDVGDIVINTPSTNVYLGAHLMDDVDKDDFVANFDITIGGVNIDTSKDNFGLESWQNEFIEIQTKIFDDAQEVTGFTKITEDKDYLVTLEIYAQAGEKELIVRGENGGTIHVFVPELTFKDSTAYYGDSVPTDYKDNLVATAWRRPTAESDGTILYSTSDGVTMVGKNLDGSDGTVKPPVLTLSYTPDASVMPNKDLPVNVTVKIINEANKINEDVTSYTWFKHKACEGKRDQIKEHKNTESPEFYLHPLTCSLTIKKTGANTTLDPNQSFIFNVANETGAAFPVNLDVAIVENGEVTITGLPVGTYTVTENGSWSWRYEVDAGKSKCTGVVLSSTQPTNEATVTNKRVKDLWLDGDCYVENWWNGTDIKKRDGNNQDIK